MIYLIIGFFSIVGIWITYFVDKKRTEVIKDEHLIKIKLQEMFPNNLSIESPVINKEPFNIRLSPTENNGFNSINIWINHKDTSKISMIIKYIDKSFLKNFLTDKDGRSEFLGYVAQYDINETLTKEVFLDEKSKKMTTIKLYDINGNMQKEFQEKYLNYLEKIDLEIHRGHIPFIRVM
tara:strand:+ start:372 stop:908 length:537 start_codon:yes stop_codon:yes gene_type:complete